MCLSLSDLQGLNGGKLPSSIDSHFSHYSDERMESCDMDHSISPPLNGFHPIAAPNELNGFQPPQQTHLNGFHHPSAPPLTNGFPAAVQSGLPQSSATFLQKDILLSDALSRNELPIAGRKRGREELTECPSTKRCRESLIPTAAEEVAAAQGQWYQNNNILLTAPSGPAWLVPDAPAAAVQGAQPVVVIQAPSTVAAGGVLMPIAAESESISLCSHAFFCSHKYKNAPCI